ncbi:MAG: hypothetical protein DMG22_00925 [Acidobacteria bacterium]|nr:MAG: hypothetical protein DMG22_00925 [Acidobacteriota bacterium]
MNFSRRQCLKAMSAGLAAGAALGSARQLAVASRSESKSEAGSLRMPGPYRGRVAAIENTAVLVSGQYQAEQVRQMMRRGMMELTGADDWAGAWRRFFEPGDVVGIKLNPVGQPLVKSDATIVREIIAGLEAAGVKRRDIVAYDRYRHQFFTAGYDKWLPEGVRISYAAEDYDSVQQAIEGYDPDHYMDMALTLPSFGVENVTARRSYAARFITRDVHKLVNVPVLKDHQSAGITLALKNLSHGLVNNVNRSHSSPSLNACNAFIPAVVAMPVIRNKAVLHILDGVKGVYHGGPSARSEFVWEHNTIYFATDPVSLDHVGWDVIDAKRVSVGMKKLAEDAPDQVSTFVRRQPEHVEIAGALGLGEWERSKIDLRQVKL